MVRQPDIKAHSAIKIAPNYSGPTVHVNDASLVVEVCNKLLNPKHKEDYVHAENGPSKDQKTT